MYGRTHRRISVDWEIHCRIGNRSEWVVLYDLSSGGAMIEAARLDIQVGDQIQLNLHDIITASGRIAWKINGNAGVKFDGLLSNLIVEHLGFSTTALSFDEQLPRDRLGEKIDSPAKELSSLAPAEASHQNGQPSDWLDTATLRDDRRGSDRADGSRRKEERLAISANAKLCKSLREGVEGRMIDLSTAGCSFLDPSNSFQPGDNVWLKMEALELWRGTVRWVRNDKVGIEFERPFYPAVLNHLVEIHQGVVVTKAA